MNNEKYRYKESDGEDGEILKKRYAKKTIEELNAEFEEFKKKFLEEHKNG